MNSIEIGKHIVSILQDNQELTQMVQNKIFPLIAENETTFPFIIYKRSNIQPNYTKDLHSGDTVMVDITCFAIDYFQSLKIAQKVRDSFELQHKKIEGVRTIHLLSASEDYAENAYSQNLSFNFQIK